jgi:RNA polymerase primary sigma factor
VVEKLNKIVRAERKLRAEKGREPSSAEIARELGRSLEEVEQIRSTAQAPVSLSQPVGNEDDSELGDFLSDATLPLPDESVELALRSQALQRALATLPTRERRVLELRYGLNGEHPQTLDEVGRTFNLTRERIRQIEVRTVDKLSRLATAGKLREIA